MAILILALLGCTSEPTVGDAPVAVAPVELPPIEHRLRTTKGTVALDGLDRRIANLEEGLDVLPGARDGLFEALSVRMTLAGKVSDLDRMLEISRGTPLEARALVALHEFDAALALDPSVADAVALARQQDLDALEAKRREAVEAHPSTQTWGQLADVLAAQGRTAEADAAYWEALAAYRDVSPLTVADIQFRRGLLWGESGEDPDRARALYTDAVTRLPGFVRANVHLAELEHDAGDIPAAIERVRSVGNVEDPEPVAKLAQWLEGETAERARNTAINAYDALLARHRLAFADHAAELFIGIGDTERAAELARDNLANRPTRRAKELCERAGC
ncbi:MAG: hypothetical protein H6737_04920 [Alphaproteobacteria bacterium]|nr:hypothetical protein [Alphaproteobacteria bacterium]